MESAKCFGADILLLFVFTQPLYYGKFAGSQFADLTKNQIDEIGEKVFRATLKDVDTGNVSISKKIDEGQPAQKILEELERGIDLVVMGSRGHGAISGAVTGSVTQKVLALAPCPIMVVK